ncbi:MAG: glycogen synthase GlgA [Candidatus Binataceae bacterium]
MKIAIVAAEMGPYAKAGGLADVIGALPQAFKQCGATPSVILPGYRVLLERLHPQPVLEDHELRLGDSREAFRVLRAEGSGDVPLYLIDHPGFFDRDGIYGEGGKDYPDNLRRYIFFGRAAAIAAAELIQPDLVHAHDWHAAVAPIMMRADASLRERFSHTSAVFTIHNLAFQGIFESADFPLLNLDWSWYSVQCLEFYGRVNLMKGALVLSDGSSTVSPTYAHETAHDPDLGFAMDGVLRAKGARFKGILNGADYTEWDPAHDQFITARYTPSRRGGKKLCNGDLRDSLNLPLRVDAPVIGMVTRMTPQKGVDLLASALERLMLLDVQLVMLASGDPGLEAVFKDAQARHPDKLRVVLKFDNAMAHRIQAGSDMFLMPSRFEPCGLTQMYALKYGTAPIVRATGGLRDTVSEFDAQSGNGSGFVFEDYTPEAMMAAIERAVAIFHTHTEWRRLTGNCFKADFSWERAAREYLDWFRELHLGGVTAQPA